MAAIPTKLYTILDRADIFPNMAATKSNPKNPTKPQFKPPIITKAKMAILKVFFSILFTSTL